MARSKSGKHPRNSQVERERNATREHAAELTEEQREDARWQGAAYWSGDPNFRERFPEVMEQLVRATRLAAEELGLGVVERDGAVYVRCGKAAPNVIAYQAASRVLPPGWEMVLDPYPPDADVDYGYSYENLTPEEELAADAENDRRAQEVWEKIEPRL